MSDPMTQSDAERLAEHMRWLRVICEGPESGSCTCADACQLDREAVGCAGRWEAAARVRGEPVSALRAEAPAGVGEPTGFKATHPCGESEPVREAGLAVGSPIPAGWKMVPVEPTEEQYLAGYDAVFHVWSRRGIEDCYRFMLAASPSPPAAKAKWTQAELVRALCTSHTGFGVNIDQNHREMVAELAKGNPHVEEWDKWYSDLPIDLKGRLSLHDFKRLGDCFKSAFNITATTTTGVVTTGDQRAG